MPWPKLINPLQARLLKAQPRKRLSLPRSLSTKKLLIDSMGTLMDDKLAPLIRMQANLQKLMLEDKFSGPKMTDIIGGIGWIMGLFGIAAFFWSFKRKPTK